MHKHLKSVVIAIAALTAAHPFEGIALDAAERAAAVLAEARKALGGADALDAVKTLHASGDFRRAMGEMQMEGELEILLEPPDKLRRNEEFGMPGGARMLRTEVLNGNDVWDDSGHRGGMGHGVFAVMRGPGGENMDPERLKELQRTMRRGELARYKLAWLLAAGAGVAHAGVAEAPDGKADVLEVAREEGAPIRLFVDQETRLPLMLSWKGPQPRVMVRRQAGGRPSPEDMSREAAAAGPEGTFELHLSDYRKVGRIQLPHRLSRSMNGQPVEEWTVKSYKVNAQFKPNTFTK